MIKADTLGGEIDKAGEIEGPTWSQLGPARPLNMIGREIRTEHQRDDVNSPPGCLEMIDVSLGGPGPKDPESL